MDQVRREPPQAGSYRAIWALGWPVMINMSAQTLFSLVDLYWIGGLGTDSIAAVSLCGNIMFSMFGLTMIIYAGALAMISRRVGAQQLDGVDGAEGVSAQALHLGLLLGAVVAGLGVLAARPVMALFDVSSDVTELGTAYLVPSMASFAATFPGMALGATFTAAGDTRTPMYVGVSANLLNAALDPFLIFGWAGLPAWGVAGAAIATLSTQVLALAALGMLVARARLGFPRPRLLHWYGTGHWARMLRIGVPGGLGALTRPFSTLFLLKVIATFGPAGVAAFGITVRALSLSWLYYGALSTAVSTLTGQALGRQDLPGVRRLVANSTRLSIVLAFVIGTPYFVWARDVVGLFEQSNAEVLDLGATFMRLLVVANLATAFSLVWGAVMNGAGDTMPPMLIAVLSNWVVKLPLAWALALPIGFGVEGIWWAMAVSLVFEAVALLFWYRRDRWMHAEV
jgi:putative MATE family efflux protein